MKSWRIVIAALALLFLAVGAALAQTGDPSPEATPTAAQHSGRARGLATALPNSLCASSALRDWLSAQQNAISGTSALVREAGNRSASALVGDMLAQLAVLETQPRPACADAAMNWTYAVYVTWIKSAICHEQADPDCRADLERRINAAVAQAPAVFNPLLATAGIDAEGWLTISADDFQVADRVTSTPTATFTPTPTATLPRKSSPRDRTPTAPTPDSSGLFVDAPEARVVRQALDSSQFRRRVSIVEVIDPDRVPELRGQYDGLGIVVVLRTEADQQAEYETDSLLIMETVGTVVSRRKLDLRFLILVAYDPATSTFVRTSLVRMDAILDYQAGRITRDHLLESIEIIDGKTLPQV